MKRMVIGLIVLLVLIQLVPYGKEHPNPKVVSEPEWNTHQTRSLFMRACGDCHSNETKWPWYSNIAPVSWMVSRHVEEGRAHFNVSMWGYQKKNEGDEAVKELKEGEMPLATYVLVHPEARLSREEKGVLIEGLKRTFGEEKHHEEEDED